MNARRLGTWLAATIAVLAQPVVAAIPTPTNALIRTVSASRQFVASASDRLLSSALCGYAEHVKREWLRQLDVADNWRDPILLLVQTHPADQPVASPVSMAVFQTDEHLEYRIRCLVPPPIDEAELSAAMVDVLCLEWANREQATEPGKAYVVPGIPLWLVEGLAVLIEGSSRDSAIHFAAVRRGRAAPRSEGLVESRDSPRRFGGSPTIPSGRVDLYRGPVGIASGTSQDAGFPVRTWCAKGGQQRVLEGLS